MKSKTISEHYHECFYEDRIGRVLKSDSPLPHGTTWRWCREAHNMKYTTSAAQVSHEETVHQVIVKAHEMFLKHAS